MQKVVGGIAAMVALGGGILAQIDPITSLQRAALAFLLGWLATQVWYVFFTVRVQPIGSETGDTSQTAAKQGEA